MTTYFGKICEKHPEMKGERYNANSTCVQCSRDISREVYRRRMEREGKPERVLYTPEEAKERIRQRDRERNARRRADPVYVEKQKEAKRRWRESNREAHRAATREYENRQRKENPQWRLAKNLRNRLRKALRGETTGVSAVRDLGTSIPEFQKYIANLFEEGMTWENYGEWHLDHIVPLSAFDLTDEDQVRVACHYTNIQPLWAEDNMRKGNKLPIVPEEGKPHRSSWDEMYTKALATLVERC